MLYSAADFFMLRCAMLPFSSRFFEKSQYNREEILEEIRLNPLIQEAIAIASPSLYQAFQKTGNDRKEKATVSSILKYLIRMQVRCTPFGLFSCVKWGRFGAKTFLEHSVEEAVKKVKPDMEWIYFLIERLIEEKEIVQNLKVMKNPQIVQEGERLYLAQRKNQGIKERLSIRHTSASRMVLNWSSNPILYSELETQLLKASEDIDKEIVQHYLWSLFQKKYLIPELLPPIDEPFNLNRMIKILERLPFHSGILGTHALLRNLEIKIYEYENQKLGEGLLECESLFSMINETQHMRYPLQVDTYDNRSESYVNQKIRRDLEEAVSIYAPLIFGKDDDSNLNKYLNDFLEKYGTNRLVPIQELVDEIKGLGFPDSNQTKKMGKSKLEQLLSQELTTSKEEICIDAFSGNENADHFTWFPPTIEVFFDILGDSSEAIDRGEYKIVINPSSGSSQAGSTFGRFNHLFRNDQKEELLGFLRKEQMLIPDQEMVEASFFPETPRTANVCFFEKMRSHQVKLHYSDQESLSLEDIYVGAKLDRLYLYSSSLKKELFVTSSNAVNISLAPPILKLLIDISTNPFYRFRSFLPISAQECVYFPRVRYKNVILSPRRWCLDFSVLGIDDKNSKKQVLNAALDAFQKYKVPAFFYLSHFDHKILINQKNPEHMNLVIEEILENGRCVLLEGFSECKRPVRSKDGSSYYFAEFVLPFRKKDQYAFKKQDTAYPSIIPSNSIRRTFYPGGEWIYMRIYTSQEQESYFLCNYLKDFVQHFANNPDIHHWHYIRYREEGSHVRLRICGNPETLNSQIYPSLNRWVTLLTDKGIIKNASLHPYEREIERYGGPHMISHAEFLFSADSMFCLNLMETMKQVKNSPQPFLISALNIIYILRSFGFDFDRMKEFLSPAASFGSLLNGSREYSKILFDYTRNLYQNTEACEDPFLQKILKLYSTYTKFYEAFSVSMNEDVAQWNNPNHVIDSIIHMHCNRFMGIDNDLEKKARILAYHCLKKMTVKEVSHAL